MTVNHAAEALKRDARMATAQAESERKMAADLTTQATDATQRADRLDVRAASLLESADTLERIHGSSTCYHCNRPTAEPGCVEDTWAAQRDLKDAPLAHVTQDGELAARERHNILHTWAAVPHDAPTIHCLHCPATKPAPLPGVKVYGVTGETLDPNGPTVPQQRQPGDS